MGTHPFSLLFSVFIYPFVQGVLNFYGVVLCNKKQARDAAQHLELVREGNEKNVFVPPPRIELGSKV